MNDAPSAARAVVIGCGIVGNCLAYHLTRLGWTDVVLLDKGPLPNPGGSTGHASNFIFLVDHSKEMTQLTLESVRQYRELGRLHGVRRHRGRAHRGADGGAPAPDGLREVVGHRAGVARHAGGDQGARPVHRRVDPPRRLPHAGRRRRRLAPRGDAHARARRSSPARSPSSPNTEVHALGRRGRPDPARRDVEGARSRPRRS